MNAYVQSVPGRIMTLALLFATVGGGLFILLPGAPLGVFLASTFGAMVLAVLATGFAVQDFPNQAVLGVLFLPPMLFLDVPLVLWSGKSAPVIGYVYLVVAAAIMLRALVAPRQAQSPARISTSQHAHAMSR